MDRRNAVVIAPSLLVAAIVLIADPVFGWESDVHYGLTKWLAIQAGFTVPDAETIASGTLNLDHGIFDARHLVFHYACIGRDQQASEIVRDAHFPSFAKIPNRPEARRVEAGSKPARRRAEQEVEPTAKAEEQREFELGKFGEALHPLQDSWSHQGVPDTPKLLFVSCSDKLSWGHPDKRDGWRSHAADFTYRWPEDTLATAKATYALMEAYLAKRKWPRSGKPWTSFEGEVREFAKLETKTTKKTWFNKRGFTDLQFLDETTLDDGDQEFSYSARLTRAPAKERPEEIAGEAVREIPADVRAFYLGFFNAWLTEQNFEPFLERFVAMEQAVQNLRAQRRDREVGPDMVAARLWIWRLRDHGLANKLGHGLGGPKAREAFGALREAFKTPKALTDFKSTEDGLIPLVAGDLPYLIVALPAGPKGPAGPQYAALARFKNAPHDVVMVTVSKVGDDWRVVGLDWTIDH